MPVKTRFAPSPTGMLHVGGARTALFSWLYAKRYQGQFVLRIEDTDTERSTKESLQSILDAMAWLGLDADEGPHFQSARYPRYEEILQQLLADGKAYRCTCSKERLDALRERQMQAKEKPRYDGCCRNKNLPSDVGEHVVRFKTPKEGSVSFIDQVYGDIHVENSELDDLIIRRSDGNPTYNFVVVVDDWDMQITHVIRGDDHINNTPRQIHLFEALNAPVPVFAHLPMILGEDGKRLSKRHGAVSVLTFKEQGILPHALLNYIVRLGWSHGDKELFSSQEMSALFDLTEVSRAAASFNYEKLYWLNQHYLKSDDSQEVAKALAWHFKQKNIDITQGPSLAALVEAQAERCKTLDEMCDKSVYFYEDTIQYDERAVKKNLRETAVESLQHLYKQFEALETWERDMLQTCINDTCVALDIGMGKVAQPLRVAVTGGTSSPSIDLTLVLIGKCRVLARISAALEIIANSEDERLS